MRAPDAPGKLGEAVDVMVLRTYLVALSEWLEARRNELDELDEAVRASDHAAELTGDMALNLQVWRSIQVRHQKMLQVWDGGRVGRKEQEQLSSLIWGRLEEAGGDAYLSGLTVPQACRTSDALTEQLRTRLTLDPVGTESLGRLRSLRAGMERIRDQVALVPQEAHAQAAAYLASLEQRLKNLNDKAIRGGDVGGLLGPLENDAALFERDLIVASATGSYGAVGGALPTPAATPDPAERARREAHALRESLVVRTGELHTLVAQAVQVCDDPPHYAVPDVEALGPVPEDAASLNAYVERLNKVSQALTIISEAYAAALAAGTARRRISQLLAAANDSSDEGLMYLTQAISTLGARRDTPPAIINGLVDQAGAYLRWLQSPDKGGRR